MTVLNKGIFELNRFLNKYLFLSITLGLYVSFHLESKIIPAGGLNLTIYDFYLFVLIAVAIIYPFKNRKKFDVNSGVHLSLYILLFWHLIEAFRTPDNYKALTLCLILIRDYFILFLISYLVKHKVDLYMMNDAILKITTVIVIVYDIIFIFLLKENPFAQNLLIYEVERGSLLRFEGLAGDPNFYAFLLILPINILLFSYKGNWFKRSLILLVLFFSVLATVSRSGLLLVIFQVLIYFIFSRNWKLLIYSSLSLSIILIPLLFVKLPTIDVSLWESLYSMRERGNIYSDKTRTEINTELSGHVSEAPIIGLGLRSSMTILGRNAHNSWLEALVEMGLIGVVIMFIFIYLVLRIGLKKAKINKEALPWALMWINVFVFMFLFSYFYHPFLWFIAGTILGAYKQGEKRLSWLQTKNLYPA